MNVCSQKVSRRYEVASQNNTYQIFKRMVWLVEMNNHLVTPAVVSDALIYDYEVKIVV